PSAPRPRGSGLPEGREPDRVRARRGGRQPRLRTLDPAGEAGGDDPGDPRLAGPALSGPTGHDHLTTTAAVGVRPPRHVEVRLPDLPRRDPAAVARVARAPPRVEPR